jgi:hypothetical protein
MSWLLDFSVRSPRADSWRLRSTAGTVGEWWLQDASPKKPLHEGQRGSAVGKVSRCCAERAVVTPCHQSQPT